MDELDFKDIFLLLNILIFSSIILNKISVWEVCVN